MNEVTGYPFYGYSIIKVRLFIRFLISLKVTFNQAFLTSSGNLVTSVKFLDSRMNCDTYELYSPKSGN